MSKIFVVEYIWLDGSEPTKKLRSKTKIMKAVAHDWFQPENYPSWSFDGSSTKQSTDSNSDLILKPVRIVENPLHKEDSYTSYMLALCEVYDQNFVPHSTNTRDKLVRTLANGAQNLNTFWGFEQEYVLLKDRNILGWPTRGYPGPQGPYYCGVGADEVIGRNIVEEHLKACVDARLMICGVNAEVMLGQWEFQIGYREMSPPYAYIDEVADPLLVSDHLWLARWLLYRTGEKHNVYATLEPKPQKGNWAGSGCHCNISTEEMRSVGCEELFIQTMDVLKSRHETHMEVYGSENINRLTGMNETAEYDKFTWGVADREASVRIPTSTAGNNWKGYFEDRRPAANVDPYEACNVMLETLYLNNEFPQV